MSRSADPVMLKLTERIRQLWCEEMRLFELRSKGVSTGWGNKHMSKWDGGRSSTGVMHTAVWPKIADNCISNNMDPDKLIRAMFYGCIQYAPFPNMATGTDAVAKYIVYTSPRTQLELTNKFKYEFESQKSRAISTVISLKTYQGLDEATAWKYTLASKDEPLSYLFRYCVAKNQNWNDVADIYAIQANKQYARHKEIYNKIWQDWIPSELKAEGKIDA